MFCTLRLVRLVKLAAPPGSEITFCSHARLKTRTWISFAGRHTTSDNRRRGQEDVSEDDLDMDAVEAKLESLVNEEKRRKKSVKFHTIRRQLSERGAPERRLSWDAIEQIRYLKQESPEEWTVQRLAEGFSVRPDVISRILRSKFSPTPERKLKQDMKVLTTLGQLSLKDGQTDSTKKSQVRLPTHNNSVPAMLSSGNTDALIALGPEALAPTGPETRMVPSGGDVTLLQRGTSQITTAPARAQNVLHEHPSEKHESVNITESKGLESDEDQDWGGVFLTEKELEELMQTLQKPSPVEQKGREFFDSEGNFLYRI